MNEQEIIQLLSTKKQTEEVCGRFKYSQLKTDSKSRTNKISQKLRYFALALLMAFGIPKISKAQLHKQPDETYHVKGDVAITHMATLSGTIKNKVNHIVLSQATVQLWKDNQLLYEKNTNENGFYEFKRLEPGTYTLKLSKENYVPYIIQDIKIVRDANVVSNIELNKTPKATKPNNTNKIGKICVD